MKKIGLFGPYGFGNMGDASLVESAKSGLQRHIPDAEFVGICQQPQIAANRHNIPTYSIYANYFAFNYQGSHASAGQQTSSNSEVSTSEGNFDAKQTALDSVKSYVKSIKFLSFPLDKLRKVLSVIKKPVTELVFLLNNFRLLRTIDLLVMPGSGQLNEEWGGAWKYPFALFKWCLLAHLAGCKIAFLSIGSGTVKSSFAKLFCKCALKLSHYISYRDPQTKTLAQSLGILSGEVLPDLAFSLRPSSGRPHPSQEKVIVGINPIAYCDPRSWYCKDIDKYHNYIDKMVDISIGLYNDGYQLLFIPNEIRMDNWVIDDIVSRVSEKGVDMTSIDRAEVASYDDILTAIDCCDYVLASRFHGLLFSYLLRKPTIAISFHYKLTLLAHDAGQEKYCLPIDSFSKVDFMKLFHHLVDEREVVERNIDKNISPYPDILELQFAKVAGLINK